MNEIDYVNGNFLITKGKREKWNFKIKQTFKDAEKITQYSIINFT